MTYAIIGFGNMGQALARTFARHGIDVSVATTRARGMLQKVVAPSCNALGPTRNITLGDGCA